MVPVGGTTSVEPIERARGIEPPFQAWEACVLPLNHARERRSPGRAIPSLASPPDRVRGHPASLRCPMTQPDPDLWPHVLSKLSAGTSLDRDEAAEAMRLVM